MPVRPAPGRTQPPQNDGSAIAGGSAASGRFSSPNGAEGAREGHGEGGSSSAALLIAQHVGSIKLFCAAVACIRKAIEKRKAVKGDAEDVAVVAAEHVE